MSGESAPYAQFLEQLPATIDRLAASAGGETEVHLPLKLDLLPAMLQYLLSTGQMSTDHVAYQSLERLCLLALNKDRMTPANRFAPLLEFATAQRNMFGAGCAHFMHGQGLADGATAEDPASFFALHNSGQHHGMFLFSPKRRRSPTLAFDREEKSAAGAGFFRLRKICSHLPHACGKAGFRPRLVLRRRPS